jgi:formyl-CoA transferase
VPAGPVLGLDEATALPPVIERGSVQRIADVPGVERPVHVYRAGYRMSGGAPQVDSPPPALGQHTEEVLRELGYSAGEIAAFRESGAV